MYSLCSKIIFNKTIDVVGSELWADAQKVMLVKKRTKFAPGWYINTPVLNELYSIERKLLNCDLKHELGPTIEITGPSGYPLRIEIELDISLLTTHPPNMIELLIFDSLKSQKQADHFVTSGRINLISRRRDIKNKIITLVDKFDVPNPDVRQPVAFEMNTKYIMLEAVDAKQNSESEFYISIEFERPIFPIQIGGINLIRLVGRAETNKKSIELALTEVDQLVKAGRCRDASERLEKLERQHGCSSVTRERSAGLHLFAGEYEKCNQACIEALISLPPSKSSSDDYKRLCRLRTESLVNAGLHETAFQIMKDVLRVGAPTHADLISMRLSLNRPDQIEEMFNIFLPYFSYPGARSLSALLQFALACRDFELIDRAVYSLRQRFLSGVNMFPFGGRKSSAKREWTVDATAALLDLRDDLASVNVGFFLISGTLLGCVRDGAIIGHDKDIDIGVMDGPPVSLLKDFLSTLQRFKMRPVLHNRIIKLQHINGVNIDLFIHWTENGLVYHEGQKSKWWNSPFELNNTLFLGHEFTIPVPSDRYLSENYGTGWIIPDPNYETFVDTPNMETTNEAHMVIYLYDKLWSYYYSGKKTQFLKVWNALCKLKEQDDTLTACVADVCASLGVESIP